MGHGANGDLKPNQSRSSLDTFKQAVWTIITNTYISSIYLLYVNKVIVFEFLDTGVNRFESNSLNAVVSTRVCARPCRARFRCSEESSSPIY